MIEARIQGIPCLIDVTYFFEQKPLGRYCDSRDDCYGYTEIEYDVCDRRGRKAPWLERKMKDEDYDAVERLIIDKRGEI